MSIAVRVSVWSGEVQWGATGGRRERPWKRPRSSKSGSRPLIIDNFLVSYLLYANDVLHAVYLH